MLELKFSGLSQACYKLQTDGCRCLLCQFGFEGRPCTHQMALGPAHHGQEKGSAAAEAEPDVSTAARQGSPPPGSLDWGGLHSALIPQELLQLQ